MIQSKMVTKVLRNSEGGDAGNDSRVLRLDEKISRNHGGIADGVALFLCVRRAGYDRAGALSSAQYGFLSG